MAAQATLSPPPRDVSASAIEPTAFQRTLREHLLAGASWLLSTVSATNGAGSSAFYSRPLRPRTGWAEACPKSTGYIIPTLYDLAEHTGVPVYAERAGQLANWLLSVQHYDGALPEAIRNNEPVDRSVFGTGQAILGWVTAYRVAHDRRHLDAAVRAADWLVQHFDVNACTWVRFTMSLGYAPAYFTRVAWPLLELRSLHDEPAYTQVASKVLDQISSWQHDSGAIDHCGEHRGQTASTHTIGYTLRGLLESARLLGDDGDGHAETVRNAAQALLADFAASGSLAGAYDTDCAPVRSFTCPSGSAQIATIWLTLAQQDGNNHLLNAALNLVERTMAHQCMHPMDAECKGAVPGSVPLTGEFAPLRYPNRATNFFVEALLLADRRIRELLENGPCASS